MEGIADGRAVDTCFYCALLYPQLPLCPCCDNRMHFQRARMQSSESLAQEIDQRIQAFLREQTVAHATELLQLLHDGEEEAIDYFEEQSSVSLLQLRRLFPPEHSP